MGMRHLLSSKRQSSSSAFRTSNHSLGSANLSSRYTPLLDMEDTNTNSQTSSSPSITSKAVSSNTEQTSFSPTTTEFCQNPMGMRQLITSKRLSLSSFRTSNLSLGFTSFSSRSTHYLDMEATNSNSQPGSSRLINPHVQVACLNKLFEHSLEDLLEAGIVTKAKTAEELEIGKAKDIHDIIEIFYNGIYYPAKVRNPQITNSWAIAHPDAPEIKELGIDARMQHFNSQLQKSRKLKELPMKFIFENPIFFDIKEQRAYMQKLVASLE